MLALHFSTGVQGKLNALPRGGINKA